MLPQRLLPRVKRSLVSIQTDKACSLPSNNQCGSTNSTSGEVTNLMTILPAGDFLIYVLVRITRLSINDEQAILRPGALYIGDCRVGWPLGRADDNKNALAALSRAWSSTNAELVSAAVPKRNLEGHVRCGVGPHIFTHRKHQLIAIRQVKTSTECQRDGHSAKTVDF